MMKIKIKPLSVNEAWKGRKFKTENYNEFENGLFYLLPKQLKIPEGPLEICFYFGLSSKNCDWDNPIKPAQDVICKTYGINDNRIFRGSAEKIHVPVGQEYIEFEVKSYVPSR